MSRSGPSDHLEANRRLWDEWARVHERSEFYALDSFKAGETQDRAYDAGPGIRVRAYEVQEVGDVRGKRLLHLQCHFGIDTLSWARLGADVTGVDFSPRAIGLAGSIADEIGVEARFVESTIDDLPSNLEGVFDIVYTSRGAIWWLADLDRWAAVIAHFLRAGGTFYMTEFHPILQALDDAEDATQPRVVYPYFPRAEPLSFEVTGSYADRDAKVDAHVEYGWPHSLGEVVTAIADAGLRIDLLHEFDWVDHRYIPLLEKAEDDRWRLPSSVRGELPLMYSLKATKPD